MNRFFNFFAVLFVAAAFSLTLAAEDDGQNLKNELSEADSQQEAADSVKNDAKKDDGRGFVFGSYGRVQPATDLRGGSPKWVNIVSHGSRLDHPAAVQRQDRKHDCHGAAVLFRDPEKPRGKDDPAGCCPPAADATGSGVRLL